MATGNRYDNQYDVAVAKQANADATQALQAQNNALVALDRRLTETALTQTLTKEENEVLSRTGSGLQSLPADRQALVTKQISKLKSATPSYAQLQTSINTTQTAVKSTQLAINSAEAGVRITQGKSGSLVSPAIDSNAKQAPYVVPTVPQGNSDLLNNPTGLILGATALTAITSNPNLISSIGNGIGRFFNNAADIMPVSTNVPKSAGSVNPTLIPTQTNTPAIGALTSATAPVDAQIARDAADLQIAAESANPVSPLDTGYTSDAEQIAQANADAAFNARLDRAADVDLANSGDAAAEAAAREKEAADLRIASESATPVDGALVSALDPNEFGAQAVAGEADTAEANAANQAAVGKGLAQKQAVLAAQKKMANNGDWRVRLSLAPGATYLYNAPNPGILEPLKVTDGIVFPYMPKIETNYKAEYDTYNLTHSNYRGYFYKGSYTDAVSLTATFTAQDSAEATYLLAVIHFFKSVTKMFYGQDPERGAPPPLVYLTGLGQYQFSAHPCVVNNFQLSLPNDVDYIRARSVNINGANLLTRRTKQDLPTNPISGAVQRLQNLFSSQRINKGAIDARPAPPTLGLNQPTYVPTKMDISLTLYPIQSRQQVSRQFSLKGYANGDLLKGGFW